MNIQITIGTTPALEKALLGLTSLLSSVEVNGVGGLPESQPLQQPVAVPQDQPNNPVQPQQYQQSSVPVQQTPIQQPLAQQQAPIQQHQPAPQTVPTSAATYSIDQLAVAATQLMDAGKRNELTQLLATFGVQALTALPTEQYGAFATKLRELGANI